MANSMEHTIDNYHFIAIPSDFEKICGLYVYKDGKLFSRATVKEFASKDDFEKFCEDNLSLMEKLHNLQC